jgi:hypothetical protein
MVERADVADVTGSGPSVGPSEVKVKRVVKRIPAKVVGAAGTTYLVEWSVKDDLKRAYIPGELWNEEGVEPDVLAAGAPYGLEWETIIKINASPEQVARALRNSGVWTAEDFRRRIEEVEGLFKGIVQLDVFSVLSKMEG